MLLEHESLAENDGAAGRQRLAAGLAAANAAGGARAPEAALRRHDRAHRLQFEDPYRVTVVFPVSGEARSARFTAGDCKAKAGPGFVSMLPPGVPGTWRCGGRMEYVNIRFPVLFAAGRVPASPFCRDDDDTLGRIGQIIAAALRDGLTPEPWDLSAWSTLIGGHLARRYGARAASHDARAEGGGGIAQAIVFIHRNLPVRLKVAELAQCAGMSRSKFAAEFKRQTGVSPHRFIVSRRIDEARELLSRGGCSLADIAHATGFSSQSHMTRAFREELGMTPKSYRDRLRESGQVSPAAEV